MSNPADTPDKKSLEERLVALQSAASFLNTQGGYTNISVEHSGGSHISSWKVTLKYSIGSSTFVGEGCTSESAFNKLQETFMKNVREEENRFATRMGYVYKSLGIERT